MPSQEPNWLNPEEYQIIVAPSLKVAAELAASRGDPKLYQELPSMLCLIYLITRLRDLYIDQWGVLNTMSSDISLAEAPQAACAMVLAEANVEKTDAATLLSALSRAYSQVIEADICHAADEVILQAWEAIKKGDNEQFIAQVEQAAKKFVAAVVQWEQVR